MGFRRPDGGSAEVLGYDVVEESLEVRARVGFASEVNSLYQGMTVPRICRLCRDLSRSWNQDLVDRYIGVFGLPWDAKIRKLSKGQKAQLQLCLALGSNPELLILDEPTSGLDPAARRAFLKVLVGDVAAEGRTVFFSTHLLSEIEAVADTVGIIKDGRLLVSGELDEMRASHRVFRVVYAEMPPEVVVRSLRTLPDVRKVEREGRGIKLGVRGDVEAVERGLRDRPHPVVDVDSTGMTLEDIFVAYVEEGDDR
jgi:ABC-2 type transport system ATP-binding protein